MFGLIFSRRVMVLSMIGVFGAAYVAQREMDLSPTVDLSQTSVAAMQDEMLSLVEKSVTSPLVYSDHKRIEALSNELARRAMERYRLTGTILEKSVIEELDQQVPAATEFTSATLCRP